MSRRASINVLLPLIEIHGKRRDICLYWVDLITSHNDLFNNSSLNEVSSLWLIEVAIAWWSGKALSAHNRGIYLVLYCKIWVVSMGSIGACEVRGYLTEDQALRWSLSIGLPATVIESI